MFKKTVASGLKQAGEREEQPVETVGAQGVPGSSSRLYLNFTLALCLLFKGRTLELDGSGLHRLAITSETQS